MKAASNLEDSFLESQATSIRFLPKICEKGSFQNATSAVTNYGELKTVYQKESKNNLTDSNGKNARIVGDDVLVLIVRTVQLGPKH